LIKINNLHALGIALIRINVKSNIFPSFPILTVDFSMMPLLSFALLQRMVQEIHISINHFCWWESTLHSYLKQINSSSPSNSKQTMQEGAREMVSAARKRLA
jgi:hypothetical protein